MTLSSRAVLLMCLGLGGVAHAAGPVWVRVSPGATPAVRGAVDDLYARAVAGGLQEPGGPPPIVARIPTTKPAEQVAVLLREGEDAFFAIELGRARVALNDAWEQLRLNPMLLSDAALGSSCVTSGLLTLARADLHDDREDEAVAVLGWLLATVPDAEITSATQPSIVVDLAAKLRAAAQTGDISWEVVGRAEGCRLIVHGVDRGTRSPVSVAAGQTLAWVQCGDAAGWVRHIEVPAGGVAALRTAPAAEAGLRWDGPTLVPEGLAGEELAAALTDVAQVLGAAVVAPLGGQGALSLVEVLPDGSRRTLDTVPSPQVAVVVAGGEAEAAGALSAWGWSTLAVGAALVAGGGALHAVHDARVNTASPGKDDLDAARSLQGASIGLYTAGGAALATGVVLLIVDAVSDDEAPPMVLGAGQGGAIVLGRF